MSEALKRQTILIVDDVPANLKILGESLKSEYKVRLATNGVKALEIAGGINPPDLILLDILMPGMDGYEVCEKLKADSTTAHIPVIFITAMDQEKDETRGLDLGAVDYIIKPFSLPIAKARVRTHLELKRHRDLLENLSTLDGLTGIPNRRRFDDFLNVEWLRCLRESMPISLIMADIDHFKLYNDNYGHTSGDDCLKQVARCLAASLRRPVDFIARYGGEEFGVVLPSTDLEGAVTVGRTLVNAIAQLNIPHAYSHVADHVTVSLGVATLLPTREFSSVVLVDGADKCLYQAKNGGRNKIEGRDLNIDVAKTAMRLQ